MDIKKAFDSLDHTFVISVLNNFGLGNNFVSCIETFISKQESYAINGGNTTLYFHPERRTRQGDHILTYIFILALEVLSFFWVETIKTTKVSIFLIIFLYTQLMQKIQHFFLKVRNQQRNL